MVSLEYDIMHLTPEELENLSELLLSNDDANTEIAFAILSAYDKPNKELLTDVFVVYKFTKNDEIKTQAIQFLENLGLGKNDVILKSNVHFDTNKGLIESDIRKRISTYVLASNGVLDGVKLAIVLYKKYKVGLHYILEKGSVSLQRIFLKNFIRGTSFEMKDLGLTKIPDALYSFEELTSIDLSNNNLVFLPSKITVFKQLIKLNISKNQFKNLCSSISLLNQLTHLDLSYNEMKVFPKQLLQMKQLTHLNLERINKKTNYKIKVPAAFQDLPNILELSMFDHELNGNFTNYPIFSTLSQEEPINLNKLSIAEFAYQQNRNKEGVGYLLKYSQDSELIHKILQEVFLDGSQTKLSIEKIALEKLPIELIKYSIMKISCKELKLTYEGQDDIFEVLSQLTEIKEAEYETNYFTEISPHMIASKNINQLSFKNNKLSFLPKEIEELKDLEVLSLERNVFKVFPKEILACKKLKKLILSNNYFEEIPTEIGDLENLEELHLYYAMKLNNSDLLTVPSTFRNLKKLKKIIFNDDKIESFYHTESSKRNYHYYMKSFQKELPSNCEIVLGYQ